MIIKLPHKEADNNTYRQLMDRMGVMGQTDNPTKFALRWSELRELAPGASNKLIEWARLATKAYPPNTLRAWKADWAIYRRFCESSGVLPLPASPEVVAAFIAACQGENKKPATIRRYLATVARAHLAAGLASPCASEPVRLALKALGRIRSSRQRQARALGWGEIKRFIDTAGEGIRATRERALLCVAYDTMARRSELVALNVEDIDFLADGTGRALIRRSKTDQAGEGASAYLSAESVKWLQKWLGESLVAEGALFRRLIGRAQVGPRLHADQIADIYKRVALWIGLPADEVAAVSGHSIRVGATQDLLALNIDLASVMQAGRWKSTFMPMRYGETVLAGRGGMARAAKIQGRSASPG
jgi:integrase